MMQISLSTSNGDVEFWHPTLLQKGQWALQPFVTFTKRFTDGDIGCPTLPTTLHPIDFNRIVCPKIILSIIASLNTVQ